MKKINVKEAKEILIKCDRSIKNVIPLERGNIVGKKGNIRFYDDFVAVDSYGLVYQFSIWRDDNGMIIDVSSYKYRVNVETMKVYDVERMVQ